MDKKIVGLVGIIITLVLILVAFFTPWYNASMKGESGIPGGSLDMTYNFYLTKAETKGSVYGEEIDETGDYSDYKDFPGKSVFNNTMYLTIIATILSIIALVGILGLSFNFGNPESMKKLGGIFGFLTLIFAIIAPVYFMYGYGDLVEESYSAYISAGGLESDFDFGFWFSYSEGGNEMSLGPGIAWYIMIVAGIIALISSIVILKADKEKIIPQKTELQ